MKTAKVVLYVLLSASVLIILYKKLYHVKSKSEAIKIIMKDNPSRSDVLNEFDESFLIAWADAIFHNEDTFTVNNKIHSTRFGTYVKG